METAKEVAPQSIDDEAVIRRVMAGDKASYEQIMRKYNRRLYRIVRSYLQDEDEIEDVIQDAYIRAYEQLSRFEGRSSFSTWLIRIAINEALARVRHRSRLQPILPEISDGTNSAEETSIRLSNHETPLGTLMNAELKEILEQAVDRLPEKYKSVFLMREVEGMSIAETSDSLAISEGNVKVRLNRAKEMLRETISDFYHADDVFHFDLRRCDRIVRNVMERLERV